MSLIDNLRGAASRIDCGSTQRIYLLQAADALEELEAKTRCTLGVGNGSGQLFVYGDYESIKAAQAIIIERDILKNNYAC